MFTSLRSKSYYPWLVVALLWVVALLNYMDRQMLSTMKDAMMLDITELQSAENFGILMAIFLWIYGCVSPFAGAISDRVNRKWLIVGSIFIWSLVTFLMGVANDFTTLKVLRALMGVSEALYIPAGLSLIADYHEGKSRSLAVGIHMTGLQLAYDLLHLRDHRDGLRWDTAALPARDAEEGARFLCLRQACRELHPPQPRRELRLALPERRLLGHPHLLRRP